MKRIFLVSEYPPTKKVLITEKPKQILNTEEEIISVLGIFRILLPNMKHYFVEIEKD